MRRSACLALSAPLVLPGCGGDGAGREEAGASSGGMSVTGSTTGGPTTGDASTGDVGSGATGSSDGPTEGGLSSDEEIVGEGEHVVILTEDPSLAVCAGTVEHMDRFVEAMAGRMGIAAPVLDERLRFHWWPVKERLATACGAEVGTIGCASGDDIYSLYVPHNHELVHALARRLPGSPTPAPFFSEGLADAHEGYSGLPMPAYYYYNESDEDIVELVQRSPIELGEGGYGRAGRFTRFLMDSYGVSAYFDLYAALDEAGKDVAAIDATFQEVLGTSFFAAVDAFSAPWTADAYDVLLSECDAPSLPWTGDAFVYEEFVFCGAERAIGPYGGEQVSIEYTIDVPADGSYELRIDGDEQELSAVPDIGTGRFIGVAIAPCERGKKSFVETRINGTPRLGGLYAGRNTLRLLGSVSLPWYLSFTLKRLD